MEKQLQEALAAILSTSLDAVQAGVGFLQAEIPDVIRQLLMWKFASSALSAFVGLLVLAASVYVLCRAIPIIAAHSKAEGEYRASQGEEERAARKRMLELENQLPPAWIGSIVSVLFGAFALVHLVCHSHRMLQIWIAPKVYLIEYAASLASK